MSAMSDTMRSIRLDALVKEMDELKVSSIAVPQPTSNQVRIRVESAGANFFDYLMCRGEYQTKPPLPFTPGCEFAGVVLECGSKVSSLSVGARVCGMAPHGCFQQQLCISASSCVLIPEQMSFDEAAGFLMTNGTSYVGLVYRGGLKSGETVLVHAAAGGVGLAAVQIARALGAKTIIGTVGSDEKIDVVKRAGAHHVINYAKNKDWANEVLRLTDKRGIDVVYDPVGGDIFTESIKCTAWLGRILIVGFAGGKIASVATNRLLLKQISVVGVYFGSYMQQWPQKLAECFQELFRMHAQGSLSAVICATYPLDQVPQALNRLKQRQTFGKVIIHPQKLSAGVSSKL